jgi:hypothetical protein
MDEIISSSRHTTARNRPIQKQIPIPMRWLKFVAAVGNRLSVYINTPYNLLHPTFISIYRDADKDSLPHRPLPLSEYPEENYLGHNNVDAQASSYGTYNPYAYDQYASAAAENGGAYYPAQQYTYSSTEGYNNPNPANSYTAYPQVVEGGGGYYDPSTYNQGGDEGYDAQSQEQQAYDSTNNYNYSSQNYSGQQANRQQQQQYG